MFFLKYAPFCGSYFETSRDDRVYSTLRFHTNGCKTILHTRILRFLLGEPSMYRHGLGTRTERLSMSHIVDMMPILMLAFEANDRTWCSGFGSCNHQKDTRDVVFEWEFISNLD